MPFGRYVIFFVPLDDGLDVISAASKRQIFRQRVGPRPDQDVQAAAWRQPATAHVSRRGKAGGLLSDRKASDRKGSIPMLRTSYAMLASGTRERGRQTAIPICQRSVFCVYIVSIA